jgi:hypothetical protein
LQRITCKSSLINWTDEIVGDTHIGKHKQKTMTKKGKGKKNRRECLGVMRRLLARDRAQNTKNPTLAVPPPTVIMAGMEVANTVLNHLVRVHSSHVRSTN